MMCLCGCSVVSMQKSLFTPACCHRIDATHCLRSYGVGRGDLRKPLRGILHVAALSGKVDVDEAKALRVTFGPFEIVENRLGVVAADVGTVAYGAG
jgi:hypothetical protein